MGFKIVVDYDLCEANTKCESAAPAVFRVEEDDTLTVLQWEPPDALRDACEDAVVRCPRAALSIEET